MYFPADSPDNASAKHGDTIYYDVDRISFLKWENPICCIPSLKVVKYSQPCCCIRYKETQFVGSRLTLSQFLDDTVTIRLA
jgi:hypothetical protein